MGVRIGNLPVGHPVGRFRVSAGSLVATLVNSSGPGIGFPAGTTPACQISRISRSCRGPVTGF